jgi:hypothetical protein
MFQETKKRFPELPIIPTFGNNDMLFNYQIPGNSEKDNITSTEYFDKMKEILGK